MCQGIGLLLGAACYPNNPWHRSRKQSGPKNIPNKGFDPSKFADHCHHNYRDNTDCETCDPEQSDYPCYRQLHFLRSDERQQEKFYDIRGDVGNRVADQRIHKYSNGQEQSGYCNCQHQRKNNPERSSDKAHSVCPHWSRFQR